MTPDKFTIWVKSKRALGLTTTQIAKDIGLGRSTLFEYMKDGSPRLVDLAIAAYDAGLTPIVNVKER